jgi:cation diffusion facilitator CzcD-associated flavoprotein CzcO
MPRPDLPRVAVLGAGPIGLEAALYARTLGLPVKVFERGRVGEHLYRWGHVRLFSPFGMNSTPLGRAALRAANARHELPDSANCPSGREHLAAYLEPLAKVEALRDCVRTETHVLHVGRQGSLKGDDPGDARRARQPFRLVVREGNQRERAEEVDVVLDCTGTYGKHRWLGDGGIPALGEAAAEPHIAYGLEDILGGRRGVYAGKNVVVIGAGYSAATTVCNLAALAGKHPDTWVTWFARGTSTLPIKRIADDPLRERDRLAVRANMLATRADGNVEFHPHTVIDTVECAGPDRGFRVSGRTAGKPWTREADRVIANVGYTPDTDLYRELQVHECYASLGPMKLAAALAGQRGQDCLTQTSHGADTLRNPEPNFFIIGAKSYGRNSNFLLRIGFEQIREVFTLITGKPALNLYQQS